MSDQSSSDGLSEAPERFEPGLLIKQAGSFEGLSFNWGEAFKGLVQTGTGGGMAIFTGSGIADLANGAAGILTSVKRELSAEALAWNLLAVSLQRALAALALEGRSFGAYIADGQEYLEVIEETLKSLEIRLEPSFFERPGSVEWLKPICSAAEVWFNRLNFEDHAARTQAEKLPRYFVYALHKTWSEDPSRWEKLRDSIDTPFARADANERAWREHALWLDNQLDQPLFGEPQTLRQLYVPLRAYWVGKHADLQRTKRTGTCGPIHMVDLANHMDEWLVEPRSGLKIVCGGPGSGKSSFAKVWAAEKAKDERWRVLFVPLHLLESDNLRESLAVHAKEQGIGENPLEHQNLLLLLDVLDELSMSGKSGLEAAQDLVNIVQQLIRNCRQRCLKVLVGGREILIDRLGSRLEQRNVLHALPLKIKTGDLELPATDWIPSELPTTEVGGDRNLLEKDQREEWWRRWAECSRQPVGALEAIKQNPKLDELSRQPLLNHLIALYAKRHPEGVGPETSLNDVYADVLKVVWRRTWGKDEQGKDEQGDGESYQRGELVELTEEQFNQVFNEIGLALWQHGGGRSVTSEQVRKAAEASNLLEALLGFEGKAERGALTLLTAFYFRDTGYRGQNRVFELMHKSFGEYFAARRLIKLIKDVHEKISARRPDPDGALREWVRTVGASGITEPIAEFLRAELAVKQKEHLEGWRSTLETLMREQLEVGMPAHDNSLGLKTYREIEKHAVNCEINMYVCLNLCASVTSNMIKIGAGLDVRDI